MKLPDGSIIWVVFAVVFFIVKNIAKKAEQSKGNNNASSSNDGTDALHDFFNQLNNVKTTKTSSSPSSKPKVKSVEDFFKVENKMRAQAMQRKRPQKPIKQKPAKVKERAQVFASAARRDSFKIAEEKPCCDAPDIISVFSEEEHAFKDKIVGEEGSVDYFDDKVCNKHKYEFTDRQQLREAVVWAEILKEPKALQQ